MSFAEEQFDELVVGNHPPGEEPAASSGQCNHNFISETWTNNNEVSVDTRSPVSVVYLTDQRFPNGPPGNPGAVLIVTGSTRLVISVEGKAPRTVTFLVVATTPDREMFDIIINYHEWNEDPRAFFDTTPANWSRRHT